MAERPFVSASRRTDIPAWYAPWFMGRVRAGYCRVRNPFRPSQSWRVALSAEAVRTLFFWTRHPGPMLPFMDELEGYRLPSLFHVTVTGLHPAIEPFPVALEARLDAIRSLAATIGPERVWWRYDPIVLSPVLSPDWHRENFRRLADALAGSTSRVTLSLVDWYRKTERRMKPLEPQLGPFARHAGDEPEVLALVADLAAAARARGMLPVSCCEPAWREAGIEPGACIDAQAAGRLFGFAVDAGTDPGQRPHCRCAPSWDIGAPHTCPGGCLYCYSTSSHSRALEAGRRHRPDDEYLVPLAWNSSKD